MSEKKSIGKLGANGVIRSSTIVFIGTMCANVAAYVYHLLMGRQLGPSGYGELSSLLSILYIFTVPMIVGQTVLVKFVSSIKAHGDVGQVKSLLLKITKMVAIGGCIGFPLVLLCSPVVTGYLHLSSQVLFPLVYVLFVITLLSIVASSILQGYQVFIWFSALSAIAVIAKVLVSVPLAQFGVTAVLWAAIIATLAVYLLYVFPLKFVLSAKPQPSMIDKKDAFTFAMPTFLTVLGITSLYSTDVILVRHYFSATEAGMYAALAILGKIIFYASSSVSLVMFPIISERAAKQSPSRTLVLASIAGVAAISALLCAAYFVFPSAIVKSLFGNSYTQAGPLLGMFGAFLGLYSVAYITINLCLATGKTGVWFIPVIGAILQIAGIMLFHSTIYSIILLNILVCAVLVAGGLVYFLGVSHEKI